MSERSEINERSDKVLRNDIRLARMIREARELFATMDHTDFGVTTHEIQHMISVIETMKARTGEILAKLHPVKDHESR